MGALPSELPWLALPQVPFTLETLQIILPVSLTLTMVGLLESLMTAAIVDEMTDTTSNKNRECAGQGVANIASGFLGGMAGCAMIGQSVINVSSGGRGRLSTLWAGSFLLFLIVVLGPYVGQIPMAALVAVMIMVSVNTFQWKSLRALMTHPKSSSFVMLGTVVVVVATHDLAKGVLFGVILSGLFCRPQGHEVLRHRFIARRSQGGAHLQGDGADILRHGRGVPLRLRLPRGGPEGRGHRPLCRPLLGHFQHQRARSRGAQVPPSRHPGRCHRHERGDGHNGRAPWHTRQARGRARRIRSLCRTEPEL
jgi:SulP family sulfate permease